MSGGKRIAVKINRPSQGGRDWAGPVSIRKRSGDIAPFDSNKIREAIRKANVAAQNEALPPAALDELTRRAVRSIPQGRIPSVEQVQDLVDRKSVV